MTRIDWQSVALPAENEQLTDRQPLQGRRALVPEHAPSLPLQVLAGRPRSTHQATRGPSAAPEDFGAAIDALFARAEKKARRKCSVYRGAPSIMEKGAGPTRIATRPAPPAEPLGPPLQAGDRAMLMGALAGTAKFADLPWHERDHIFKMLEADDRAGLKWLADTSGPLRALSTGLKACTQLLEKRGADNLPPALRGPLTQLKAFYEGNRQLILLGDERAWGTDSRRSVGDIWRLRQAFREAYRLLNDLRQAIPA